MPKPGVLQLESESHSFAIVRWRARGLIFPLEFFNWCCNEKYFDRIFTKVRLLVNRLVGIVGFWYSNAISVWLIIDPICQISFIRWLYNGRAFASKPLFRHVAGLWQKSRVDRWDSDLSVCVFTERCTRRKRGETEMWSCSVCFSFRILSKCVFML